MGYAVERVFLPVMRMQYPEIADVAMPAEGIFHNLMIVAIRKSYPGHARKIMNAIWSLGQAMFTKVIVVVDHDVDVHNYSEVVWKALCAIDPERDVQFNLGPADTLDHASRIPGQNTGGGLLLRLPSWSDYMIDASVAVGLVNQIAGRLADRAEPRCDESCVK